MLSRNSSSPKKIDYAVAAPAVFINHLHTEGIDRGMIATFGDTFRVEQSFTTSEASLYHSLARVSQNIRSEGTRLNDSIEDVISEFWRNGRRNVPWILTIITDGSDNQSRRYRPAEIGQYVARRFNHEPSNFITLVGVGENHQLDRQALGTIGNYGGFPAYTIAAFPMLEALFLRIALQASTQVIGRSVNVGNLTWQQVAYIRQMHRVPIDYAFLIDRSYSMTEKG
jgi:hypothetical protein